MERKMAEEQPRCQEGHHRLCVNNCGFFGSPATMDLCSNCYSNLQIKEQQHASSAKIAVQKSLIPSSSPVSSSVAVKAAPAAAAAAVVEKTEEDERRPPQKAGRCAECSKKVGLVGFMCRCGASYCGAHRYPEKHRCTFDFKAAGREEIARANPVVIADKLEGRI